MRKNALSNHDRIHKHRNLNETERSMIARLRNFNPLKICKVTVMASYLTSHGWPPDLLTEIGLSIFASFYTSRHCLIVIFQKCQRVEQQCSEQNSLVHSTWSSFLTTKSFSLFFFFIRLKHHLCPKRDGERPYQTRHGCRLRLKDATNGSATLESTGSAESSLFGDRKGKTDDRQCKKIKSKFIARREILGRHQPCSLKSRTTYLLCNEMKEPFVQ